MNLSLIDPETKTPFPSHKLKGLDQTVFVLPPKTSFFIRVNRPYICTNYTCFLEGTDIGCVYRVPRQLDHFDLEGFYSFEGDSRIITPFVTAKPVLGEDVPYDGEGEVEKPTLGTIVLRGNFVRFCSSVDSCTKQDRGSSTFSKPSQAKLNYDTSFGEGLTTLASGTSKTESRMGGCNGHPTSEIPPLTIFYTSPLHFDRLAYRYGE